MEAAVERVAAAAVMLATVAGMAVAPPAVAGEPEVTVVMVEPGAVIYVVVLAVLAVVAAVVVAQ